MNPLTFTVGSYESQADIKVSDPQWHGNYTVKEISAEEGRKAVDELIAGNVKYQENPESLTPAIYKAALMSKAITITKPTTQ